MAYCIFSLPFDRLPDYNEIVVVTTILMCFNKVIDQRLHLYEVMLIDVAHWKNIQVIYSF